MGFGLNERSMVETGTLVQNISAMEGPMGSKLSRNRNNKAGPSIWKVLLSSKGQHATTQLKISFSNSPPQKPFYFILR